MPFLGQIGPLELLLVLALALIILGPGKLPEVGAAFGRTIREFRKASTEVSESINPPVPVQPTPARPAPAAEAEARPVTDESSRPTTSGA
ncbi:MAG TPA: twin-arginine translocase TatA/TatE family subunit [Candidatus Limnocylindrales bacterium]|jgi:sec-independent protein translocase protein TatA|nr:twin-arginine translocase TatA/TatE family subunit [Candidatus Limnocylindrales bacterium]